MTTILNFDVYEMQYYLFLIEIQGTKVNKVTLKAGHYESHFITVPVLMLFNKISKLEKNCIFRRN